MKRVGALAAVLTVCWGLAWVAARSLVVEVTLPHADALLVFSGAPVYAERVAHAARLVREGRAPKVLLTDDGFKGAWSSALQRNPTSLERAFAQFAEAGVVPAQIDVLPGRVSSTHEEAALLKEYALAYGLRSIIVVTSRFHTLRALWTLRRVFDGTGIAIGIEPAAPGPESPSMATWWSSGRGWSAVAAEYPKLLYYVVHY